MAAPSPTCERGGVLHSLDMYTRRERGLPHHAPTTWSSSHGASSTASCSPAPTGTNAVEAAIKLARLATGRPDVVSFTNALPRHDPRLARAHRRHLEKRAGAGLPLRPRHVLPYCNYVPTSVAASRWSSGCSSTDRAASTCRRRSSSRPCRVRAAVNVASIQWLRDLAADVPRSRHPAHRRRRADRLRSHRAVLQLRGRRDHARHHHAVEVAERLRVAPRTHPVAPRPRPVGARAAQRDLPGEQRGLRHGDRRVAQVLVRRPARTARRGSRRVRGVGAAGDRVHARRRSSTSGVAASRGASSSPTARPRGGRRERRSTAACWSRPPGPTTRWSSSSRL